MGKTIVSEGRITTPVFRLSFPHVFEAAPDLKGSLKFSLAALFPKEIWDTELVPLRNLVKELIIKKYGDINKAPKKFFNPFHDGDEKTYEGYAGTIYINAASDYPRPIVDAGNKQKNIKPQEIFDPKEIYAGCYCKAVLNAYAWDVYDAKTHALLNSGVSLGYLALQKIKDGEPFSKFNDASADFEPITSELVEGNKEELFDNSPLTPLGESRLLDQL